MQKAISRIFEVKYDMERIGEFINSQLSDLDRLDSVSVTQVAPWVVLVVIVIDCGYNDETGQVDCGSADQEALS